MKVVIPSFSQNSRQLEQVTRSPHHWCASSCTIPQSSCGSASIGASVCSPRTEKSVASWASEPGTKTCV